MVTEMKKAFLVLLFDAICWTGASIALAYFNYTTLAAAIGAFGIVYVINGVRYLRDLQKKVDQVMKEVEDELLQEFNELMGDIKDQRTADLKWQSLTEQFERQFLAEQRIRELYEDDEHDEYR